MTTKTARKRTRGQLNRQIVMETAVGLFNRQGYDRTSMNDIADALGITKAGLYYHFPSKEDIFAASVAVASTIIDAELANAKTADPTSDPLSAFIRAYGRGLADETFRCLVLADERSLGTQARAAIRSCKSRHQRQLEQLLRDSGKSAAAARALSLTIFGALNWTAFAFGEKAEHELSQLVCSLAALVHQA